MKMLQISISDLWLLGVWLTNLQNCAEGGNQISRYFGVLPPSLDEYLDHTLGPLDGGGVQIHAEDPNNINNINNNNNII